MDVALGPPLYWLAPMEARLPQGVLMVRANADAIENGRDADPSNAVLLLFQPQRACLDQRGEGVHYPNQERSVLSLKPFNDMVPVSFWAHTFIDR